MNVLSERIDRDAPVADCYSGGERAWMQRTQRLRATMLEPLLRRLSKLGITPDAITGLSLLCGLAFCPLWFVSEPAAIAFLFLHVALDGLDGPLARHTGVASRRGSFTDTLADQTVVTATTIALMIDGAIGIVPGSLYINLYALVVVFAMVRNALDVPYSWLYRPRFLVYAWFAVEAWLWPGSLDGLLWVCVTLLGWKGLTGFGALRRRL